MKRLGAVPPWGRYSRRLGGLGDVTSSLAQLAQYNMDDITAAYNWLNQAFSSENQDLGDMITWFSANGNSLSAADQQSYMTAIQNEVQVVQNLGGWLNSFQLVMGALNSQIPGLSGLGRRRLGVFPVIAAGVIVAIIALIVGVTVAYVYHQISLSQQAHDATLQLQGKVQQQAISAGWTPDQVQKLAAAQNQSNQPPPLSQIPWTTIALVTGAVFVAKSVFE
jgi:hypothetical protein